MQQAHRPVYERPTEFFALTYPTPNLRELVRDVALRLAGRSDKAYRKLAVNYGGGKTHTLIALRHLVHDPDELPDLPAVREFEAHVGFKAPRARVAALCFDKIDVETGVETPGPDGKPRKLRHPWSALAWQLAGADGLRLIHADGQDAEREKPSRGPDSRNRRGRRRPQPEVHRAYRIRRNKASQGEAVARINELLTQVSDTLRLSYTMALDQASDELCNTGFR